MASTQFRLTLNGPRQHAGCVRSQGNPATDQHAGMRAVPGGILQRISTQDACGPRGILQRISTQDACGPRGILQRISTQDACGPRGRKEERRCNASLPGDNLENCLEIARALIVAAVAIQLNRVPCAFTRSAAVLSTRLRRAAANRILTFLVCHGSSPSVLV